MKKLVRIGVLALLPAVASAQFVLDNQTNTISSVVSNWAGNYYLGDEHSGDGLVIMNGGVLDLNRADAYLGYTGASSNNSLLVSDRGSALTNGRQIWVGGTSTGNRLTIANGGVISNSIGVIGYGESACNNAALVTGAGSAWSIAQLSIGGAGGSNQLTITNGGTVYDTSGTIGDGTGANNNMALVTDAGSVWSNSTGLVVGNSGAGNRLTIANGGVVYSGDSRIGNFGSANDNTVRVTGSGSVWRTTGLLIANNASTGNGLIVSNGGLVTVSGNVTINTGGYVTNYVERMASGLDIREGGLTLKGKLAVIFASAPSSSVPLWGIRVAGLHVAALRAYAKSGALTINDMALPKKWRNKASIYWDGTYTYVGFNSATDIVVTPDDFGAVGNGVADDTDAFHKAAQRILTNGRGTLALARGKTYRVGRQYHVAGQYPYYQTAPMFEVQNPGGLEGLKVVIEGNGATVKLNDGLRIGSFDKDSGAACNPTNVPFTDGNYAAAPGDMFTFDGCASVAIRNVTIDGNVSHLITGGTYGDTGYQCAASGISLRNCDRLRVDKVTSSHCGLDGIMLGYYWLTEQSPAQDWVVSNSRFEYNARQGMSWIGGKGMVVTNCKFNHTGRESFCSSPYSGLDIEAENSVIRNGLFVSCDFVNNTACGMVADTGDSANVTFTNCLFWGTTTWSIWPRKPGFRFNNCRIYGTALKNYGDPDPSLGNQFHNCHFEDYEGEYEGKRYSSYDYGYLICFQYGGQLLFDGCTMVANKCKAIFVYSGAKRIIKNCRIYHNWTEAPDRTALSTLGNVYIENTKFYEKLGNTGKKFCIAVDTNNVTVGPGVSVDGPQCTWGEIDGHTGSIGSTIKSNISGSDAKHRTDSEMSGAINQAMGTQSQAIR